MNTINKKEIFNFNFVAFGIGIEQPELKKIPVELSSSSESLLVKKKTQNKTEKRQDEVNIYSLQQSFILLPCWVD